MQLDSLYRHHLEQLDRWLVDSLEHAAAAGAAFDGVAFHAGSAAHYHADDRAVPFVPAQHCRRWVPPLASPDSLIVARPGRPLLVVRACPQDYWYDTAPPPPSYWEDAVQLEQVERFEQVPDVVGALDGIAYVGPSPAAAASLGLEGDAVEPPALLAPLDWYRATKTEFEIAVLRQAIERAAAGHRAGRDTFLAGGSERDAYRAYLEAGDLLESDMPYDAIIAFDDKAAILHYQRKRGDGPAAASLLLDAGADVDGYAADITRTWWRDAARGGVHNAFKALVRGVDALERDLVAMVRPGRSFVDLHLEAHRRVAALLGEVGVISASVEEAVERRLTRVFFPHGLGHLLGLQVHDVGGQQTAPTGGVTPPPDDHVLRNTRTLEPGQVTTIEPGLYFVPMLLDPQREGELADLVDWSLVDALIPFGGVRIEDDILCTEDGHEDLTRPLVDGPPSA
ncbi:MAG: Xaa-Pro dipeptidase [Acidobacteriota bacterium]